MKNKKGDSIANTIKRKTILLEIIMNLLGTGNEN